MVRTTFIPGDQAVLSLTLTPGDGEPIEDDLRKDTHLESAVLLASIVASLTIVRRYLASWGPQRLVVASVTAGHSTFVVLHFSAVVASSSAPF